MKHTSFNLTLATFMVAIACGGNPPPTDEQNHTDEQNPDPNMDCEPNCPVEVQTITRGLAYSLPGAPSGEVNINGVPTGTRMTLDGSRTMIDTLLNEVSRITVEGTARDGRPIRLVMVDGVMSSMSDMGTDIDLAETGLYSNFDGDWGPGGSRGATHTWVMRWDMDPDYRCLNTRVRIGQVDPYGQLCVHADDTITHCAGPDGDDEDVDPDPTDRANCRRVIWGRVTKGGDEVQLKVRELIEGVLYPANDSVYERLVHIW